MSPTHVQSHPARPVPSSKQDYWKQQSAETTANTESKCKNNPMHVFSKHHCNGIKIMLQLFDIPVLSSRCQGIHMFYTIAYTGRGEYPDQQQTIEIQRRKDAEIVQLQRQLNVRNNLTILKGTFPSGEYFVCRIKLLPEMRGQLHCNTNLSISRSVVHKII